MKAFIANLSIKTKLLISFTLVSMIPALIIFISSYNFSVQNSINISLSYSKTTVEQTAKLIENYLQVCEHCCGYTAGDNKIIAALCEEDRSKRVEMEKAINRELMLIQKSIVPQAYSIYVIGENGLQYKSVSQRFNNNNLSQDMLYWKVSNSKTVYWDGPRMGSWALGAPNIAYLTVGKAIHGPDGDVIGAVIIEMPEKVIAEMLQNEQTKQQSSEMGLKFICLMDKTFKVISHTDSTQIGTQIPRSIVYSQSLESRLRYDSNYLTVLQPIADRWMVLGGTYIPDLRAHSRLLYSVTFFSFVIAIGLAIALSLILSRFFSNPIKRMTALMQEVEEGNLNVRININYYDEIGIMGRVFNKMLKRLRKSMKRIRENEKRFMILQYDMLKEQIKPHFMYNTLDTVRWLARDGKNAEVEKMTLALMKFYRLHIGDGNDTVKLSEEIESVRNYLIIQKIRYDEEISDYLLDLPEEIADSRILRLTLQPLVENAIYHGLKNAGGGGKIRISAEYDDNRIVLCVEDTGRGMSPEKLEEINRMLDSDSAQLGLGLRNVNARIKLKYGQRYGLNLNSVENQGTQVFVTIPNIK